MNSLYQNLCSSVQKIYVMTPTGVFYRTVLIYKRFDVKTKNIHVYIYPIDETLLVALLAISWSFLSYIRRHTIVNKMC